MKNLILSTWEFICSLLNLINGAHKGFISVVAMKTASAFWRIYIGFKMYKGFKNKNKRFNLVIMVSSLKISLTVNKVVISEDYSNYD